MVAAFPFDSLLPLRGVVVTLACTDSARLPFFHQPALTAFLRFLVGSPAAYDTLIRLDAPESGRLRYRRGDYYRFVLFGLAGSDALLDRLLQGLAGLPGSAPKQGLALPFRDNWRLVAVQDVFSGEPVQHLDQLGEYSAATLADEAALWAGKTYLHWQWYSPALLLRDKQQREATGSAGEERYIRDAADLDGKLLFSRLHNTVADLLRRRGGQGMPLQQVPEVSVWSAHLFWLDAGYSGSNHEYKVMGGVNGNVRLGIAPDMGADWWALLVLGQYLGMGQRTAFGWGRYGLVDIDGAHSYRRVFPASSLLLLAQDRENVGRAWRHVMGGRDIPEEWAVEADIEPESSDGEVQELQECLADGTETMPLERLLTDLEHLFWGKYPIPDLRGVLLPKGDGGVRPLAVPPAYDRVLQRAVQQVVAEPLELLMSPDSHGYRQGRSRSTASQAIQQAWREGYRWVYEGDVHDFFDSVDWGRLEGRLGAVFGNDPVVAALLGWMQAAVVFRGERLERTRGLPQGSPLSPLLANLMLDDFDGDMAAAGFRMIRFADDFVVLCKDPGEAQRAQQVAGASLAEHGLGLHPEKSRIAAMADGFRYLGYLFVNDMALDVGGSNVAGEGGGIAKPVPVHSWLAQLGEREALKAQSQQSLAGLVQRIRQRQVVSVGQREHSGTFVAVTGEPVVISTLNKQVNAYRKDELVFRLPWSSVQCLVLFGNHQVTTQAMHAALGQDIPIHFASSSGHYRGCLTHNRNSQHQGIWMQQVLAFQDTDKCLYCAREVVLARLIHMKETLRNRKLAYHLPGLESALRQVPQAASLEVLLGYEGNSTREYFGQLASWLPEDWGFTGRNRRPPRDPFNVMLSVGYTQLYALVESLLHVVGLLPWQGFYHQPHGRHAVLASDLMEPFRHLVERTALGMVARGEITVAEFSYAPDKACVMADDARRRYLALLWQGWETKVTARGQAEPDSWLEHLRVQVEGLKQFISHGEPFHAFRLR